MFVAHRLPANHTTFSNFSLFPLLVSADTTIANDRSRSTTAMRSTSKSSIFWWRHNLSSKHHFHCASKKMVPHHHPIVITNFNRVHTEHIGKLFQKLSSLILCPKPCVVFSIDDVKCQASDVNHIAEKCQRPPQCSSCHSVLAQHSIHRINTAFFFVVVFYYLWLSWLCFFNFSWHVHRWQKHNCFLLLWRIWTDCCITMVGEIDWINKPFLVRLHVAWQKSFFFLTVPTKVMFHKFNTLANSIVVKKLSVVTFLPELLYKLTRFKTVRSPTFTCRGPSIGFLV